MVSSAKGKMSNNSRFTMAIHILALLALEDRSLTSKYIAGSVNTNPVVVRRILGLLHEAGLVITQLGAEGGATLAHRPQAIDLLTVYRATEPTGLFGLHPNAPNPLCPCGRTIQPILLTVFTRAQTALEQVLAETTLADISQEIIQQLQAP